VPGDSSTDPRTELTSFRPMTLRWSRKPSTRLEIFFIWLFLAVVYAITKSETAKHFFEFYSAACLVGYLLVFVLGPYRLYTKHSLALRADYRIFEGHIPDFPQYRVADLTRLGFTLAGQLVGGSANRNVEGRLAIFVHAENQDSAQLVQVVSGLRTIPLMVFKSRFEDGFAFETSDSHTAPLFEPDSNFVVFRFPPLHSTSDLYRIHRKLKEQFVGSHRPVIADNDGEIAEFIAQAEIVRQRHANSGHYKLAPEGDRYIYTLAGAIRHAFLMTWPIKFFRYLKVRTNAMKMADELGLPIHPKLGCLMESLRQGHSTREQ